MLARSSVVCKVTHCMDDDLIPTAEVARLLGCSVATINRWAADERLEPAAAAPGRRGGRLFRRSDVEALLAPSEAAS